MDRQRGGVQAVGGVTAVDEASFSRPANTTQYAAGDVVSDDESTPSVLEFTGVGRLNAGTGVIVRATMISSANQGTLPDFELWLFDTEPTAMEDNAAFDPTDAEVANVIGVIDLGANQFIGNAGSGASGNSVHQSNEVDLPFVCGSGTRSIWGILVARNAYTPVSGETFTVRLWVLQD